MPTPITTPEHSLYDHPEWPYIIHVSCIPLGLPRGDPLRQRFDDHTISVPNVNGSVWFTVEDAATNVVAHATFACGPADVQCDTITVDPGHQRRMIATAIYHLAASIFAASVVPSANRTPAVVAFWGTRTQIP